jgi:hypothetical protein
MMTSSQQTIAEETARRLGVDQMSLISVFGFIDQLRAEYGEQWRERFPDEVLKLVQDGVPWAAEVVTAMADLMLKSFGTSEI